MSSGTFSIVKPFVSGDPYIARVATTASTNITVVKNSPGNVYAWALHNGAAAIRYVRLYDKATAPVPASDTPLFTIILPATKDVEFTLDMGIPFKNGIAYDITAAAPDNDTTVTAANDVHGMIMYN